MYACISLRLQLIRYLLISSLTQTLFRLTWTTTLNIKYFVSASQLDLRQQAVTFLWLCFHLRKYIYTTEFQGPAEEICHMLAISFWSKLLPQATNRLRRDDSLPVYSDDCLWQAPYIHPSKGRLRAAWSHIITILMPQQNMKHCNTGSNKFLKAQD